MTAPAAIVSRHLSPLRYPGGKAKLAGFVKAIIKENRLTDGDYVEPFAGGAGVAVELLLHEYVQRIHINDISRPVYAFWRCVLEHTEDLTRMIANTPLTVKAWQHQKAVFAKSDEYDDLELGFATFYLNRTNRSGILNGGVIGGQKQTGPWKIDARFNRDGLIARVEAIARLRRRISLTCEDAYVFLSRLAGDLPNRSLIYLDPPYFRKGKDLYYDYYTHEDHQLIARLVGKGLSGLNWIVSYDDVPEIRDLYSAFNSKSYQIGYSARSARRGREIMFFSDLLTIPDDGRGQE